MMKNAACFLLLVALAIPAGAQERFSEGPWEFMVAKFAADEGDFDRALRLIDKVLASDPKNPVVRFERASILLDAGRIRDGEKELRRLTEAEPAFYDAHRLLGRVLLDESRLDRSKTAEALQHLQMALQLQPDDFSTGMTVAQILLASNKLDEAEKVLGPLAERFPDNKLINYNYAQLLTKLGRGDESRAFLERVLASDATFAAAALQLIDIYQKSNEWAKAAETLAPLAEQEPANTDMQRQLAFFYFRAGDAERARDMFAQLLAVDPKDERSRFFLGESLTDLGDYVEAEKHYRVLMETQPDDPELLVSWGLNQVAQRKNDEAEKAFRALIAKPGMPEGIVTLAKTQLATIEHFRGNYDAALAQAIGALRGPRGLNTQAVSLALDVYRRQKRYADAIAFLQPLVKELGTDPPINARYFEFLLRAGQTQQAQAIADVQIRNGLKGGIAVAQVYAQLERWNEAIELLEQLRKQNPDDKNVVFQLGSAYERSGKVGEAEKIFLKLLDEDPNDAQTLNYLGYMWADKGVNLPRAEEMIARAVKQEPRNGAFVDSLGWVYYRLGKLDLARKHLADAAELMPWDPTIQEHLGDLYLKQGDVAQAADRYRAALKLDPEDRDEAKIRTKLADIEKKTKAE